MFDRRHELHTNCNNVKCKLNNNSNENTHSFHALVLGSGKKVIFLAACTVNYPKKQIFTVTNRSIVPIYNIQSYIKTTRNVFILDGLSLDYEKYEGLKKIMKYSHYPIDVPDAAVLS